MLYSKSTDNDPEPPVTLHERACCVLDHQASPPLGDKSEIETGKLDAVLDAGGEGSSGLDEDEGVAEGDEVPSELGDGD